MPQAPLISRRILLSAIAAGLTAPHAVLAQAAVPAQFPQRPMTLILPFAPGGPVDVLGRLLAQEYQARWIVCLRSSMHAMPSRGRWPNKESRPIV
jgi:tripartite-type tricarboxylate transporter receptor subunit TctC